MRQNVLLAVNKDYVISHVFAGFKGSAHDGKILSASLQQPLEMRLRIYPGMFYVANAGHSLADWCIPRFSRCAISGSGGANNEK